MPELKMKSLIGETLSLSESSVEAFAQSLRGTLIRPDGDGYDEARTIYNAMIDQRPGLIARCANVADVISAVNFARANELLIAIRGGGHNGPGLRLGNMIRRICFVLTKISSRLKTEIGEC